MAFGSSGARDFLFNFTASTAGLKKGVADAERQIGGIADKGGKSWGSKFVKGVGKAAAIGGGIAGALISAKSLKAGYDRLVQLEDAAARLEITMGSAGKATEFLKDVEEFAYKSTYGMDQLSGAAASLAGYGVESSKIVGYLEGIGEAAAGMGKDAPQYFDRISTSFGRMAASGKISMEDINTLSDSGVNGLKILGNEFGVSADEMRKMISKGTVPAEKAMDALSKGIIEGSEGAAGATTALGGTMDKLRDTMSGASSRMQSSFQRLGAAVIGPFQDDMTEGFNGVTDVVDDFTGRAGEAMQTFADSSAWAAIRKQLRRIPDLVSSGFDKISEAKDAVKDFFETARGKDLKLGTLERFESIWGNLKDTWEDIQEPLADIRDSLGEAAAAVGISTWEILLATLEALSGILRDVLVPALNTLGAWMKDNQGAVNAAVAAFTAWKLATTGLGLVQVTAALITNTAAWVAHAAAVAADKIETVAIAALYAKDFLVRLGQSALALVKDTAAWVANTASKIANTASTIASTVAQKAATVASKGMAAATWLVNAALRANPIVLVVSLLVALGAALVTAWKKSETFRNIVTGVWNAIKGAASAAWNWIKTKAIDPLVNGFQRIWNKAKTIRDGVVGVFGNMKDAVGEVFSKIVGVIKKPINLVIEFINAAIIGSVNKVLDVFKVDKIKPLKPFHQGGYVGGRGEKPAMLLGGEGVLNRKATRAIGGRRGVDALNRRGRTSAMGGIGDWVKGAWDSVKGAGKWILDGLGGLPKKLKDAFMKGIAKGMGWVFDGAIGVTKKLIPGDGGFAEDTMVGLVTKFRDTAIKWATGEDKKLDETVPADFTSGTNSGHVSLRGWAKPIGSGYRVGMPWMGYPGHTGIDLPAATGTPVYAAAPGQIAKAVSLTNSYGKHIFMAHKGATTVYAHLSQLLARVGQVFKAGQLIGRVGSTGNSTGPHLHFETRAPRAVNPAPFMSARGIKFDHGGVLAKGINILDNRTGGPETLLNADDLNGGPIEVRVYVGDREITDIVRTEVREHDRNGVRRLAARGVTV